VKAVIEAKTKADVEPGTPMTVATYVKRWLADRQRLGLRSVPDDSSRMNLHVLPRIGAMELHEVRPRHLREMVLQLRETGKLAPRMIHHVYHLTATLFRTRIRPGARQPSTLASKSRSSFPTAVSPRTAASCMR
jgi:hypothetical protein